MLKKSNVLTHVAVLTPRIHMLLTPLWLVLVFQYLNNPSFMVPSSIARRYDWSSVVHLLEPAINRCLYVGSCNLGVQYMVDFDHLQTFPIQLMS